MDATFPRVLARYVRERATFDLAAAVHKMTGSPADTFGRHDHGYVAAGRAASPTSLPSTTRRLPTTAPIVTPSINPSVWPGSCRLVRSWWTTGGGLDCGRRPPHPARLVEVGLPEVGTEHLVLDVRRRDATLDQR